MPAPSAAPIVHSGATKAATIHATSAQEPAKRHRRVRVPIQRPGEIEPRHRHRPQSRRFSWWCERARKCGAQADREGGRRRNGDVAGRTAGHDHEGSESDDDGKGVQSAEPGTDCQVQSRPNGNDGHELRRPGQGCGGTSSSDRPSVNSTVGPTSQGRTRRPIVIRRADVGDHVIPMGGPMLAFCACRTSERSAQSRHEGWIRSSAGGFASCCLSSVAVFSTWLAATTISSAPTDAVRGRRVSLARHRRQDRGPRRGCRFATIRFDTVSVVAALNHIPDREAALLDVKTRAAVGRSLPGNHDRPVDGSRCASAVSAG